MIPLNVTFDLPAKIVRGLANETLVRNGGVIQDTSGRVVMWLRELSTVSALPGSNPLMLPSIDPVTGVLNLAMQGVNAGISMRGFAAVTQQLNQIQGMLSLTTAASVLNLGVSAIGFAVISKRLKELEKRLQKAQEFIEKIDEKLDLSFYANFRAAIDLAVNAFTMSKGDNRRNSALTAINRFLEAEHIYADLADKEFAKNSQIGDEYLLTLCLAYIAESRCYLELEEFETAINRFQEGKNQIRVRVEKYIDLLLTSNSLMYLHPSLKGKTDLSRLTRIYQWKDPKLNENLVFDLIRDNLIPAGWTWDEHVDKWISSLPASVIEKSEVKKGFFGVKQEGRTEIIQKLPDTMSEMESMIETNQRFEAYELEVKAIRKLGISFSQWLQLQPSETAPEGANVIYILPESPLEL